MYELKKYNSSTYNNERIKYIHLSFAWTVFIETEKAIYKSHDIQRDTYLDIIENDYTFISWDYILCSIQNDRLLNIIK